MNTSKDGKEKDMNFSCSHNGSQQMRCLRSLLSSNWAAAIGRNTFLGNTIIWLWLVGEEWDYCRWIGKTIVSLGTVIGYTRIYLADIDKGNGVLKWLANTRQLPVFARTRFWEGCHHYWWGKLYACCVGKSFNLEDNYYFEIIITPSLPYNYIEVVPLTLHHSEHETNLKSHSAKNSLL